jgi:hypothetical protein
VISHLFDPLLDIPHYLLFLLVYYLSDNFAFLLQRYRTLFELFQNSLFLFFHNFDELIPNCTQFLIEMHVHAVYPFLCPIMIYPRTFLKFSRIFLKILKLSDLILIIFQNAILVR